MKYVIISRTGPGVDSTRQGLEVFSKAGLPSQAVESWAGVDGKTFVTVLDVEGNFDLVPSLTYGPFFEDVEVIPVVPLDDDYIAALRTAMENW
jgi:hypothetical protein